MLNNNLQDINNDFLLTQSAHGIQLTRPDYVNKRQNFYNIARILQLPCNVYFTDTQTVMHGLNDHLAHFCQFESTRSIVGKSIFQFANKKSANEAVANNSDVINLKLPKVVEEEVILPDDSFYQCLTIKLPWYSREKKLIGIFGCSIVYGVQDIAKSLSQIAELGIINPIAFKSRVNSDTGRHIEDVYLTKRETECMHYTVRGKTSKEIALILKLSKRTVECYMENVKYKFRVYSKNELIDRLFDYFV